LNGHVPAAEVDDPGAKFLVKLEKRCFASHRSSTTKDSTAMHVPPICPWT
jgi:hypothetical protein